MNFFLAAYFEGLRGSDIDMFLRVEVIECSTEEETDKEEDDEEEDH